MKLNVYDQQGKLVEEVTFASFLDEISCNDSLIHEALLRQQANARVSLAHTLNKGEVSGGGKKPFKQKGTGHARQGSIRNPHYIGGGVAFGPRSERNYEKDMPRKQRRLALYGMLKKKFEDNGVFGLQQVSFEPKTKNFVEMLKKLPEGRKYLIFVSELDEVLERAAANIGNVTLLQVQRLNMVDLMKHDKVVFYKDASEVFQKTFLPISQ